MVKSKPLIIAHADETFRFKFRENRTRFSLCLWNIYLTNARIAKKSDGSWFSTPILRYIQDVSMVNQRYPAENSFNRQLLFAIIFSKPFKYFADPERMYIIK